MEVALDRGEWRNDFPAAAFSVPLSPMEGGRNALVPVPPPPPGEPPAPERGRRSFVIPALLVAGWGGLFAYCAAYLREDLPFRPLSEAEASRRAEDLPRKVVVLPDLPAEPPPATAQNSAEDTPQPLAQTPSAALPSAAVPPSGPRKVAPAVADYVGTWGPTPAACLSPSRRRGYLPATLTIDRARAGRTVCTFHDGHRTGNTWLMAAECSDRGRRWSSQVRLLVEGDRLIWTSNRGTATYIRCGRRAG